MILHVLAIEDTTHSQESLRGWNLLYEYILIFDEDYNGGGEDIDKEREEDQQMAV